MNERENMRHEQERCRRVALGLEQPTLAIRRGRVYSPFTGEFFAADVVLCGELVAGVGAYPGRADHTIDARGAFIVPGFIDAHVHPETSLLSPPRFAEALAVHGITTAISEPHEIVNVLGRAGMDFYLEAHAGLPLDLRLTIPTTVPASPFERANGFLTEADVAELVLRDEIGGLGEAMNYLGLIAGEPSPVLLQAGQGRVIDGHAPDVGGRELAAYLIAGAMTDHETSDPKLLLERRRLGMWTLVREGSAARDLARAMPFLVEHGTERTALCTDDRNAAALAEHHHLDGVVAAMVRAGVSLSDALRAATINPATLYRLYDRGSIAPGRRADLLIVDDPSFPHPRAVIKQGRQIAKDGILSVPLPKTPALASPAIRLSVSSPEDLAPPAPDGVHRARAIHIVPRTIVSDERIVEVRARGGRICADPDKDIALVALLERGTPAGREQSVGRRSRQRPRVAAGRHRDHHRARRPPSAGHRRHPRGDDGGRPGDRGHRGRTGRRRREPRSDPASPPRRTDDRPAGGRRRQEAAIVGSGGGGARCGLRGALHGLQLHHPQRHTPIEADARRRARRAGAGTGAGAAGLTAVPLD